MNRTRSTTILLAGLTVLVGLMGCESGETSIHRGRVPYASFPETHTLTNGCVVVVVAPRVGRIVGYHRVGKPNQLWLDTAPTPGKKPQAGRQWINYGGDKVWLAPEGLWLDILGRGWPPDSTTDSDPWTVTHAGPRKLVMVSDISPAHGARITRTITLPDDASTVRIGHRLERVLDDPHPVHIWAATQIPLPKYALLDLTKDRPMVKGNLRKPNENVVLQVDRAVGAAYYDWPKGEPTKVGTFGRWVAGVFGQTIFAQYAELDVAAEYYDQANCEVYVSPTQQYMELELLSPTEYLLEGGTLDFTITWKLLPRPVFASQRDIVKLIESHTPRDK